MAIRLATKTRRIGAECRLAVFHKLDMRSKEGKAIEAYRLSLLNDLPSPPTVTQQLLVERAAQLQLRISLLDETFTARAGDVPEHFHKTYNRYGNSLAKILNQLEASKQPRKLSPGEMLERVHAAARGGRK